MALGSMFADAAKAVGSVLYGDMNPAIAQRNKDKAAAEQEQKRLADEAEKQRQRKEAEDRKLQRDAAAAQTTEMAKAAISAIGNTPTEDVRREMFSGSPYSSAYYDKQAQGRRAQYDATKQAIRDYQTGGQQAETAKRQEDYAEMIRNRIEGKGESAVQEQLKQALAQSQRQIASTIASQRGMNPMTAARLLAQEQSAQAQGIAGKAAEARLAEQLGLEAQYGQVIGQTRTQDIEAASRQAQAAAQLTEALRSGDQAAINAAMQNLQAVRQGDIQMTEQQRLAQQALIQQQIEQAKMALEIELQRIRDEAAMNRLTKEQAFAAEQAEKDRFYKLVAAIVSAGGAVGAAAVGVPKAAKGGRIRGKATVRGDSEANDTVPALLSPGEIVIPRSIAQSKNAAERSKKFVAAIEKLEKKPKFSKKDASEKIALLEAELAALKSARSNKRK